MNFLRKWFVEILIVFGLFMLMVVTANRSYAQTEPKVERTVPRDIAIKQRTKNIGKLTGYTGPRFSLYEPKIENDKTTIQFIVLKDTVKNNEYMILKTAQGLVVFRLED